MVHLIRHSILISISLLYLCSAHPHKTSVKNLEKEHMLTTNEYYVEKVNQMAGISCDLCMRAVYGVNYDFIQLKKDVIEMIRLDCEALFHERAEDISECIRFLTTKVEKYSGKVEKILDSRHVCVLLRVCAADDEDYVLKNKMISSNKTDMMQ
uniref:Saposin B-type domain-containing protein n=2 Tax=Caenorhabditis tropicalis TaxID=1561998 RepID=A0A1I7T884_9PELO